MKIRAGSSVAFAMVRGTPGGMAACCELRGYRPVERVFRSKDTGPSQLLNQARGRRPKAAREGTRGRLGTSSDAGYGDLAVVE
jgi:hypothetical protein